MPLNDALAAVNACLNGASAISLLFAWRAIKRGQVARHRRLIYTAITFSSLFLVCYVTRFIIGGAHRYPIADWTRAVYLVVLASHTLLAMTVPFLVARAVFLAWRQRFVEHKRLTRLVLPIWSYVSVTGVVIYLMLYQLAPLRLR
jgi:putative membrane protein